MLCFKRYFLWGWGALIAFFLGGGGAFKSKPYLAYFPVSFLNQNTNHKKFTLGEPSLQRFLLNGPRFNYQLKATFDFLLTFLEGCSRF